MLDQITTDGVTNGQHQEEYSQATSLQNDVEQEQIEQASYVVHLPIFEGPLDLLLHLIEKRQMEITTISLVAVTDQYLAYLQQWEQTTVRPAASLSLEETAHPFSINDDIQNVGALRSEHDEGPLVVARMSNMAAFVSIAARLLFIKSQSLLPRPSQHEMSSETETAASMAAELQRHLQEYKLAKEIAYSLRQREEAGLQTHGRSGLLAGIETQLRWSPPALVGGEVQSLALAFQRLLELRAKDEVNNAELLPLARVRISERITEIANWLSERPSVLLEEVLENEHSRFVIIVTFLAVLEMWKHGRIAVKQETLLGSIVLERGEQWHEQLKAEEGAD